MREFLRETWELWYWAMFCPSKLQDRRRSADKRRFIVQYFLLVLCFSIPLAVEIVKSGNPLYFIIILPLTILTVYTASYFAVPFGLHFPLLVVLCYQPHLSIISYIIKNIDLELVQNLLTVRMLVIKILFLLQMIVLGTIISLDTLVYFTAFLKLMWHDMVREDQDWIRVSTLSYILHLFEKRYISLIKLKESAIEILCLPKIKLIQSSIMSTALLFIVIELSLILLVELTVLIVGIILSASIYIFLLQNLPFSKLILFSCFLGVSIAPAGILFPINITIILRVIITAIILPTVVFATLETRWILAILLILSGYFRLIPDYLLLTAISLFLSGISRSKIIPIKNGSVKIHYYFPILQAKPVKILRLLPPHSTELLWLPLPGHDRILAAAFRTDAEAALATFQQMQASPLPGFRPTIKQALPQIIADRLTVVSNIPELVATAKSEHPLLPLLIPTFYQSETELENSTPQKSAPFIKAEISRVMPRLQAVAKDVDAALETGNAALRERALELILNNLSRLQVQLPGLGLEPPAIKRWQPVLEQWQRLIRLELEEQQVQSQGELLNPFSYGNPLPLDRKDIFKGRQAFADRIVRLIIDRNRPTIVLHAPRRFGKSSFLRHLPRLLPSDLIPIHLDMQSAAVTTDEAAFCYSLVRYIYKDSRSQGIQLPAIPQRQEFRESPYIALEDWLDEALPRLEDRRLLLNLDEFEKIGSAINQGRLSLGLFDELRHLIQHYDRLSFLFSGVQTLEEMGPNWSSYFISVVPIEMLYLEPEEAEDLLVNPDPEFALRYDRNIVAEILQLTRCHPYLLQLLGAAMVTQANLNHTQLVTSDLLQAAIQDAFTLGEPYFINIWREFTGTNPQEVAAGQKFLLSLAANQELSSDVSRVVGDPEALAALRRLRRYHVIEETDRGNYRFEVPLFSMWVRDRAIRNDLS